MRIGLPAIGIPALLLLATAAAAHAQGAWLGSNGPYDAYPRRAGIWPGIRRTPCP